MNNRVNYRSYYGNDVRNYTVIEAVTFKNLKEADALMKNLEVAIKTNGHVTVADFYKSTGGIIIDSDSDYGWKNLLGCDITATRFGYTLRMTSPMYLKSDPITEAYNVLKEADEDTAIDAVTEAMNCLSEAL